jgi:hypothetical protein
MVGWKRGRRGGASSTSAGSGDRLWPSGEPKRVSAEVVLAGFQCDGVFRSSVADEREGGGGEVVLTPCLPRRKGGKKGASGISGTL